ncbi:isochorismatase family protein [Burkholderia pseudomallei MSHR640]|nr:isochorismatase family protein [Burkholderia pseudomallei MSHR640]
MHGEGGGDRGGHAARAAAAGEARASARRGRRGHQPADGGGARAGAPVCFVQHDGGADDDVVPGTPGWRLHAELTCADADWRIRKRASDAFHGTPLAAQLAAHGVDAVVICGYASEFCVDSAARRAALLGYRTTVVSDLHTTNDRAHLSAVQIVAHHNFIWSHCSFSGNGVAPRPLDEVIAAEFA